VKEVEVLDDNLSSSSLESRLPVGVRELNEIVLQRSLDVSLGGKSGESLRVLGNGEHGGLDEGRRETRREFELNETRT